MFTRRRLVCSRESSSRVRATIFFVFFVHCFCLLTLLDRGRSRRDHLARPGSSNITTTVPCLLLSVLLMVSYYDSCSAPTLDVEGPWYVLFFIKGLKRRLLINPNKRVRIDFVFRLKFGGFGVMLGVTILNFDDLCWFFFGLCEKGPTPRKH